MKGLETDLAEDAMRKRAAGAGWRWVLLAVFTLGVGGCDRGGDLGNVRALGGSPEGETDAVAATDEPAFADVPAQPISGLRPAPVDFDSHPRAREFRTLLTRGAAEGPNFAGHMTVVTWGCGTMCQELMILDARTGEVFDGRTTAVGAEFRIDSRLLLINPPAAASAAGCTLPACAPQYLVWTGSRLEPVLMDEDREAIRRAAEEYVRRETAVGAVRVEIDAVLEGWARVRVHPLADETDPAVVYLRKVGTAWEVMGLGTGFTPEDLDRMGVPPQVRPAI